MFLPRFFNVVAAETYDSSCKVIDIVQYKFMKAKRYFKNRKIKKGLREKMTHANSYEEWQTFASEYDQIKEVRIWQEVQESSLYDWKYIKNLTQTLYENRTKEDIVQLMHIIRTNAVRNVANILNPALYTKAYIGTKHLIENFRKEFVTCLDFIGDLPEEKLSQSKKIEFFAETRHAYGRTGLLFSGGGNIGLYHYGVIKSLFDENLLPRVVAGSSVGSIFASFFCVRKPEDIPWILDPEHINLTAFHRRNNKYSMIRKVGRLFSTSYLLDVGVIRDFMRDNIGDVTFQEAYDKTGWILNITVTGHSEHDGYRLLNYLTAPDVLIWSAICASCGIPYIYGPVDLYCKNANNEIVPYISDRKFVDGSIGADLPLQNLSEMYNANYFIVSQTNPWIVPFLKHSEQHRHAKRISLYRIWELIIDLIGAEIKHRVNQFTRFGILPKALARYFNLITQQYSGHVTIWPHFTFKELMNLLIGPTNDMLRHCMINGSRRVYPKINRIRATLVIERALEKNYLKARKLAERNVILDKELNIPLVHVCKDGVIRKSSLLKVPEEKSLEEKRCRVDSFNVPRSIQEAQPSQAGNEEEKNEENKKTLLEGMRRISEGEETFISL